MSNMSTTVRETEIRSGQDVVVTGYYRYVRHIHENAEECFIPPLTKSKLLFKDGEKAPMLGSCPHVVVWKLLSAYKLS